MFNSKTIFVLGAGASFEFGFPVGKKLAELITAKMDIKWDSGGHQIGGDRQLFNAAHQVSGCDVNELLMAAQKINRGLPLRKSIDEFLDLHYADQLVVLLAKTAIVKIIIELEAKSFLASGPSQGDGGPDFSKVSDTWLLKLTRMLGEKDPTGMFANIAFVSFNYDRTLERFLYFAIKTLYALDNKSSAAILKKVPIFHPYGVVGKLQVLGGNSVYGQRTTDQNYVKMAKEIRTYTEELEATAELERMHGFINEAQTLVFLGFGFHEQNIKLLTPAIGLDPKPVFATALGMSDSDVATLKVMLVSMLKSHHRPSASNAGARFQIRNTLTCSQLMDEYALTLPRV